MKIVLDSIDVRPVIYGIRCKVNNKIYIGKAKNYFIRLGQHIDSLIKNKHHCKLLQEDFDLYGTDNFQFLIIRELQDGENIDLVEIEEISKIDSTLLYNSNLVENKIISYNPTTGEVFKVYFNISDASRQTGIPFINIYLCCTEYNSTKTTKGIGFCFESDIDKIPERLIDNRVGSKHRKGTVMSMESRRKISEGNKGKRNVSVVQIDKRTNKVIRTFESLLQAAAETGIKNISRCCKGKTKSAGGFIWRYA